jgi:hypothetical protein
MIDDRRVAMDRYIGALLLAALLARGGLDLVWWMKLPGGVSLGAGVSAAMILAFYVIVARSWKKVPKELGIPVTLFCLLVLGASFRGPGGMNVDAVRWVFLYTGPLLFGAAVMTVRAHPERWTRAVLVAALIPVLWALILLGAGQRQELFLHGYYRLLGPFKNHHTLAVLTSGVGTVAVYAFFREKGPWKWLAVATGLGCAVALFYTYVRTSWLLVAGFVAIWLLLEKRWKLAGLGALVVVAAFLLSPTLRDRFSDVGNLLTRTAPEGGWASLGSWRVHIWTDSFQNFAAGGWSSFVFGNGLGGHMVLHKNLDPHSELLALLYQLGIAGPLVYLWLFGAAAHLSWKRRSPLGRYVIALAVMTAATCLISNDFLGRATFSWWFWAAVGLAWAEPAEGLGDGRNENHEGAPTERLHELGGDVG